MVQQAAMITKAQVGAAWVKVICRALLLHRCSLKLCLLLIPRVTHGVIKANSC